VFFAKIIKSLLDKYQNSLGISDSFEVDLMDDLHNVALDMQVVPSRWPFSLDTLTNVGTVAWANVPLGEGLGRRIQMPRQKKA
jgi:hypothetical protein